MSEDLRRDLRGRMERARLVLEEKLNAFDPETAGRAGVTSEWSMKELVAHMAGWQQEFLRQADALATPEPPRVEYDEQEFNQRSVRERAARSWEQVQREWAETLDAIGAHLDRVPSDQLSLGKPYRGWLEGVAINHLYMHLSQIGAWTRRVHAGA